MATHSSTLAWRIPGTGEPGGLLSLGSHRVGHDWSDLAAAFTEWDGVREAQGLLRHLGTCRNRSLYHTWSGRCPDSWLRAGALQEGGHGQSHSCGGASSLPKPGGGERNTLMTSLSSALQEPADTSWQRQSTEGPRDAHCREQPPGAQGRAESGSQEI